MDNTLTIGRQYKLRLKYTIDEAKCGFSTLRHLGA